MQHSGRPLVAALSLLLIPRHRAKQKKMIIVLQTHTDYHECASLNDGNQATVLKHLRVSQSSSPDGVHIHDVQLFSRQMFLSDNMMFQPLQQIPFSSDLGVAAFINVEWLDI